MSDFTRGLSLHPGWMSVALMSAPVWLVVAQEGRGVWVAVLWTAGLVGVVLSTCKAVGRANRPETTTKGNA